MPDLVDLAREAKATAIQKAGGGAALARLLNITRSAVTHWDLIPPDRLRAVAAVTGIPASDLRPDLADILKPAPAEADAA